MTAVTIKWDAPVKFKTASGIWAPHNYKPEYLGAITLRTALAKSINTVSAQLVAQIGVDGGRVMRGLGIPSTLPHASPWPSARRTSGWKRRPTRSLVPGRRPARSPVTILRITDADGHVARGTPAPEPPEQRLSPETAYVVTDIMKGVVEIGTGKKAQALGRPVAGKTGTSTNYRDAWFYGFTPTCAASGSAAMTSSPIGHDATGGQVSLPIWLDFMREAEKGRPARFPRPRRRGVRARQPGNRRAGPAQQSQEPPHPLQTRHPPPRLPRRSGGFSDASF